MFVLLHCPPTLLTTSQVRAGALVDVPLVSTHCPSATGRLAANGAAAISSVRGRTSKGLALVLPGAWQMLEQLKTHSPASFPAWRSVDLSRAGALAMDPGLS